MVCLGFYVGRDKYGKQKDRLLAKEERERQTFDQKMAVWDQESKAKTIAKANKDLNSVNQMNISSNVGKRS